MSGSSLALEAKAALLTVIMFYSLLAPSLTLLTAPFSFSLAALWSVCGLVLGAMVFSVIRSLRVAGFATQYHPTDIEAAQLLANPVLPHPTSQNIESEPLMQPTDGMLKTTPAYCTPLEMYHKTSESSVLDDHDIQTTFATVVEGSEDDCTFATSPFTSPPRYMMEIFVCKEETVVYDYIPHIPSGTPSPLVLNHDLPSLSLVELTKYCEAAITESNMRDMELL